MSVSSKQQFVSEFIIKIIQTARLHGDSLKNSTPRSLYGAARGATPSQESKALLEEQPTKCVVMGRPSRPIWSHQTAERRKKVKTNKTFIHGDVYGDLYV